MEPVTETPTTPRDYAALSAGYSALVGALLVAGRDRGADPVARSELPQLGLATFALAKLVAKEKVATQVREPFVEERVDGTRRPKGEGLRYAVGELLTCTRCVGAWSSLGLVALRVRRPREARVLTAVLAAGAINDFLQSGFALLCAQADEARDAAGEPSPEPRTQNGRAPWPGRTASPRRGPLSP